MVPKKPIWCKKWGFCDLKKKLFGGWVFCMMGISDEMIRQKVKLHRFLNFDHISINFVPKDCANLIFFLKNYKKNIGSFFRGQKGRKITILKKMKGFRPFNPRSIPQVLTFNFFIYFFSLYFAIPNILRPIFWKSNKNWVHSIL